MQLLPSSNAPSSLSASLNGSRGSSRGAPRPVVRMLASPSSERDLTLTPTSSSQRQLHRSSSMQHAVAPVASTSGANVLIPPMASAPSTSQPFVQQPSGLLLPHSAPLRRPQVATAAASTHTVQTEVSSQGAPTTSSPSAAQGGGSAATKGVPQQPTFSLPPAHVILLPNGQRAHSLHDEGMRVVEGMADWAQQNLLQYLKPVERSWQPQDLLPLPESPDFYDQVQALRASGSNLPFDYLVVLVGDMITEEALPSYMNMLNLLDGTKDETGAQDHPWAVWTRHWTAEENRHGNLLNKYLYLCGRVNMKSIEVTVQRLVGNGLDPQLENNPYLCFVYTSFQERATKISHANTARLAAYYGDNQLAKICGVIAADEGRHEQAYTAIVSEFFRRDPEGALLAFADMMRKGIVMPAHLLDDGVHTTNNKGGNLFNDYAAVADNIGVYTTNDYANIVEHLVNKWRVAEMTGLSGDAAAAQEYLCGHAGRIRRLANIQAERRLRDRKRGRTREASFDWIRGRQVALQ